MKLPLPFGGGNFIECNVEEAISLPPGKEYCVFG